MDFSKAWEHLSKLTLRNAFKNLFFFAITVVLLWIGYKVLSPYASEIKPAGQISTPGVASDKDLLLFLVSAFSSWIVSAWFATFTSTDKIDTIAEQSFDKMINVSIQLGQAKVFLRTAIEVGKSEFKGGRVGADGGLLARKALEHRIDGAINMIDLIKTSNESLANDWVGVVSSPMARQLKSKRHSLDQLDKVVDAPSSIEDDLAPPFAEAMPGATRLFRAATANPLGPAANVQQTPTGTSTDIFQEGELRIEIIRDTFNSTGSGKFVPNMVAAPSIDVELVTLPQACPLSAISFNAKTGTNFDFNVNLRSVTYGELLPQGAYVFRYKATAAAE